MENKCKCGKFEDELKPGHKGRCKEYRKYLKDIENSITYDYLYNEYINNGKSLKYIAKELNLLKTRILEKKLIEFNIDKRTLQEAKKQKHHIELAKQTSLEKYGVAFHLQKNSPLLEKAKQTLFNKYGVDNIMYSDDVIKQRNDYFIEKYGVDNPFKSMYIRKKIKETCIEKYGVDNPWKLKEIQNKCLNTKLKSNKNSCYYSKQSQELFWKIYNSLPNELQKHTYFAELNKEYGKIDIKNNKYYFYDFVITNINFAIEYNGDYYHANPDKYDESFYNKHLNLTAKEIHEKDNNKNKFLIDLGFHLIIIWESDDINIKFNEINSYINSYIN